LPLAQQQMIKIYKQPIYNSRQMSVSPLFPGLMLSQGFLDKYRRQNMMAAFLI